VPLGAGVTSQTIGEGTIDAKLDYPGYSLDHMRTAKDSAARKKMTEVRAI
jgi:hypothetical protein